MRVLIIGANGRIGRLLVNRLVASGDEVVAGIRKPSQANDCNLNHVTTTLLDLTDTVTEIAQALIGCDAIIFTAGAGGSYGKTLQVDLDGAVKSMLAAETVGIKRYVMVSALFAEDRQGWTQRSLPYFVAKYYADNWLINQTSLDYTLIEPGVLSDTEPTGRISVSPTERGIVTRTDVADTIVASLHTPTTIGKTIGFNNGSTPIEVAVQSI